MKIAGNPAAPLYAVGAEFSTAENLGHAAVALKNAGFGKFDVFSPYPIPHLGDAMGLRRSPLGLFVFLGGLAGCVGGVFLQLVPGDWIYPLVAGGRPTNMTTLPALIPIIFELAVLCGALTAFVGLLIMTGLPRWHHPLFAWEDFRGATDDRFFAVIEAADPGFSLERAEEFFAAHGAMNITRIHEEAP